jgi:transposase InsO family protein
MDERIEFCRLALSPGGNVAELARRFGISRKTAFKMLARYRRDGVDELADRPRRPHRSPRRCDATRAAAVTAVRRRHPAWGARKIRAVLLRERDHDHDHDHVPAVSTIHAILVRGGYVDGSRSAGHRPFVRFEHAHPNDLWQMDFKGHFATLRGGRCHPLTVLDDHSRYALAVRGCRDEREPTVRAVLVEVFQRYGMPLRLLCDNGPPWGADAGALTTLGAWLIRLGVTLAHGRPYHPQTQGKDERFHRTLNVELIGTRAFADVAQFNDRGEPWRQQYNQLRPHEALSMHPPATRYTPSPRRYPSTTLPPIEYDRGDCVRRVRDGRISYRGRRLRVGRALDGQPVALRATAIDGVMGVYYCHQQITQLDLRAAAAGST